MHKTMIQNGCWTPSWILWLSARVIYSGKHTIIKDLDSKVLVKFHLCTVNFNDFLKKTIIENGGWTPSWISCSSPLVADSGEERFVQDLSWKICAEFFFPTMKSIDFMNKRIIQNRCRTPSWISLSAQQLEILASTHTLWTSICSSVPNFSFAKWFSNGTIEISSLLGD